MYEICMLEHAFEGTKLLEIIENITTRRIKKPLDQTDYSEEF